MSRRRRAAGTGQIDRLPSGRYRVRITVAGRRRTLGIFDTRQEAEDILDAARDEIASGNARPVGGVTLDAFGRKWLDERESLGSPKGTMHAMRAAWERVARAPFAQHSLKSITPKQVRTWVLGLAKAEGVSRATVTLTLAVLRLAFRAAVEAEIIGANPARDVRLPRAKRTHEPWTYLTPDEQVALLSDPVWTLEERSMLAVAIGTGIRLGELIALEIADVHLDGDRPRIVVRYGGASRRPTKSGRIREVPLFGLALVALRRWMAVLPSEHPENPRQLVFPAPRGGWRDESRPLGATMTRDASGRRVSLCRWKVGQRRILGRNVRWHDLRHTCASSLVAGWWGQRWRLEDIRDLLGHSSLTQTERYAHLAGTVIDEVARESHAASPTKTHASVIRLFSSESGGVVESRCCPATAAIPGASADSWDSSDLAATVERALRLAAEGSPFAQRALIDAVGALTAEVRRLSALVAARTGGAR